MEKQMLGKSHFYEGDLVQIIKSAYGNPVREGIVQATTKNKFNIVVEVGGLGREYIEAFHIHNPEHEFFADKCLKLITPAEGTPATWEERFTSAPRVKKWVRCLYPIQGRLTLNKWYELERIKTESNKFLFVTVIGDDKDKYGWPVEFFDINTIVESDTYPKAEGDEIDTPEDLNENFQKPRRVTFEQRVEIAKAAMQGILSNPSMIDDIYQHASLVCVVVHSIRTADALIAELEKT